MKQCILAGIVLYLFAGCTTPYTHLRGAPGTDYFRPDFACRKGPLPKEQDARYLLLREQLRSSFRAPVSQYPFLVIAGESTAALFHEGIYKKELPEFSIMNRAIGGETTVLLLTAMDQDIIPLRPKVIFLSIGGNDILSGRCLSEIRDNIGIFLFKVRTQLPETHVILAGVPPVLSWKVNSVTPYFNAMLSDLAREAGPKVEYFDLWQILADPDRPVLQKRFTIPIPQNLTLIQRMMGRKEEDTVEYDRIHFNEFGYIEIARNLRPILTRIRQSSADPAKPDSTSRNFKKPYERRHWLNRLLGYRLHPQRA
jgi:lysophospholipase L1-like esterase